MLRWPVIFLTLSVLTALLHLTEITGAESILLIMFFIAATLLLGSLVAGEISLTKRLNKDKQDYLKTL